MEQTTLPINRLSYSSLMQLLRNPLMFKMTAIFNIYASKTGVSGMIGKACHEALKTYYGGNPDIPVNPGSDESRGIAKQIGLAYLASYDDEAIKYGKTSNREKMLKGYTQAMDLYFAEEPEYNEIVMCEEKIEAEIKTDDGDVFPLPITCIPDLVVRMKDGTYEAIDTKFKSSFTDYNKENYKYIVQAQFVYHALLAKGIKISRILFREIKITKNEDKSPQIRDWAVPFDHKPYKVFFYNLFCDAVKFLSKDPIFLPNLDDMYEGEDAGLIYSQGLISSDMSDVEVMHKVRDVAYTSKKFVASRLDSELNKNLLPEEKIKMKLGEFGVPVEPAGTTQGASMTQYRFNVSAGIRMSTVKKHKDDIARAISAKGEVRILAPIPGTNLIGVEVDNETREIVKLTKNHLKPNTLSIPIGVDVEGNAVHVALNEMPHLLIAGSTGSGKSVLLHTIITALSKQMKPEDMRFILIDPKRVELIAFAKLKHLGGAKIIYEYEHSLMVLKGLNDEMENRYRALEQAEQRNIEGYNAISKEKMPYIVVVIDEFSDLMMQGKVSEKKKKAKRSLENIANRVFTEKMARDFAKMGIRYDAEVMGEDDTDAEYMIVRLAQMARAVGIHLVIATQRPSIDVINGRIKANFPTRIALTTASPTDSNVILGVPGAEKLSGKGDMLVMSPHFKGLQRLQGFAN